MKRPRRLTAPGSAQQVHLGQLDIGGAEVVPDQVVEQVGGLVEPEFLQGPGHGGQGVTHLLDQPELRLAELRFGPQGDGVIEVHLDEP